MPSTFYKIRKTTVGNISGENFSLTVPTAVVKQFPEGTMFHIAVSGDSIVYSSGCNIKVK